LNITWLLSKALAALTVNSSRKGIDCPGTLAEPNKKGVYPDQVDSASPLESPVVLSSRKDDRPTLGGIVNLPYLNPSSIAFYSRLLTWRKEVLSPVSVQWIVSEAVLSRIDECDYLLVRTGLDNADRVSPVEVEVERMILSDPGRFTMVDHFPLPQKEAAVVLYRLQRRVSTASLSGPVGLD
jgi:hypothetical protein